MKQVVIIIPIYKNVASKYELIALQQCEKILSNYPKIVIKPQDLKPPNYLNNLTILKTVSFDNQYFNDIAGYNKLMLSAEFYGAFLDYQFMLIYQLDCFVFSDKLNYWCNKNWDYIGAPWITKTYHKNWLQIKFKTIKQYFKDRFNHQNNNLPNQHQLNNRVGNGGLSLRKVKKMYDLCLFLNPKIAFYLAQKSNLYNEDVFWSIEVNRNTTILNIPNCAEALTFAFEVPPVKANTLIPENLPFGCHDWDKYANYWRPVFIKYGYDIKENNGELFSN